MQALFALRRPICMGDDVPPYYSKKLKNQVYFIFFKRSAMTTLTKKLLYLAIVSAALAARQSYEQGRRSLRMGGDTVNESAPAAQTAVVTGFENVTGALRRSPKSLPKRKTVMGKPSSSLHFWLYTLTLDEVINLRKTAAKHWVEVKGILEDSMYKSYGGSNDFKRMVAGLTGVGIQLRNDDAIGTTYVHAKTFLLDDQFIIETANLTHSSFEKNREFFFASTNPRVLKSLQELFARDRSGTKTTPAQLHPNLVVCPINCRAIIEHLITNATSKISIYNQYIQDRSLQNILENKKNLDLKIILADIESNYPLQKTFWAQLKIIKKPYIHAKVMLVDDRFLLVGSMNFSSNSLDNNREIGIILVDPVLIKQFNQQFESDRKNH